jgi:hypothetical protein
MLIDFAGSGVPASWSAREIFAMTAGVDRHVVDEQFPFDVSGY